MNGAPPEPQLALFLRAAQAQPSEEVGGSHGREQGQSDHFPCRSRTDEETSESYARRCRNSDQNDDQCDNVERLDSESAHWRTDDAKIDFRLNHEILVGFVRAGRVLRNCGGLALGGIRR